MKLNSMTSLLVKSAAALAVSTSMSFAGVSGKAPVPPPPPEEPAALFDTIGATLTVGYDTRNYYRGLWFNDDSVWVDLSVDVPLTEQLTFNFGTFYLDNVSSAPGNFAPFAPFEYSELDLYAGLSYDLGFGTFGIGFTQYFFFNGFSGTAGATNLGGPPFNEMGIQSATELGLTFGTSFFGFDWDIGYFYDFRIGGSYYETNLSYEVPVTPWLSLVPAFQAGYGNDYYAGSTINFGAPSSGFTHFTFSLSAPIALTPTTSLTPYIAWISTDRARNYLNASANNEVFGGVSLSVSF